MPKRLQVLLSDRELAEIQQLACRQQLTTGEWVRQALRSACEDESRIVVRKKLEAIRAAARHSFPAPDIDQMLDEIERG